MRLTWGSDELDLGAYLERTTSTACSSSRSWNAWGLPSPACRPGLPWGPADRGRPPTCACAPRPAAMPGSPTWASAATGCSSRSRCGRDSACATETRRGRTGAHPPAGRQPGRCARSGRGDGSSCTRSPWSPGGQSTTRSSTGTPPPIRGLRSLSGRSSRKPANSLRAVARRRRADRRPPRLGSRDTRRRARRTAWHPGRRLRHRTDHARRRDALAATAPSTRPASMTAPPR